MDFFKDTSINNYKIMMIKKSYYFFILLFSYSIFLSAQEKEWTLKECIEYALENNISIKQSALDVETASIAKSDAIGNFVPSLNGSMSNFWNSGLVTDPITNTNSTQTFRSSSYNLQASITLFDGLRNIRQFQRAKLGALLSTYNFEKSQDDVALFVANSYLQVLLNRETLKVILRQHEITLEQLERTNELVEAGVLPQGDLLEIQATSADELTRIIQAENAVQIALINLAQILLIKDYENFDIAEQEYLIPSSEMLEKSVNTIIAEARESRYEVQIAEQNKLVAEKDLEISKGAYYPTLSASFGINTRESGATSFRQVADPDDPTSEQVIGFVEGTNQNVISEVPNFTLVENSAIPFFDQIQDNYGLFYGFSLNIPILNGFSTRNAVKRSEINIRQADYQLEQARLDLDSNVYQAYLDAKGSAKAYEASLVAVEAQELAYAYANDRYDVGLTNAFDFSQSKFRLEDAQSNAVQAKFDFIFKLKVLELYFGIDVADMKL